MVDPIFFLRLVILAASSGKKNERGGGPFFWWQPRNNSGFPGVSPIKESLSFKLKLEVIAQALPASSNVTKQADFL